MKRHLHPSSRIALSIALAGAAGACQLEPSDDPQLEQGDTSGTSGTGSDTIDPIDDRSLQPADGELQATPDSVHATSTFSVLMTPELIVEGPRPYTGSIGPIVDAEVTGISIPGRFDTLAVRFVKAGYSTTQCDNPSAVVEIIDGQSLTPSQIQEIWGSYPIDISAPNQLHLITCAGLASGFELNGFYVNVTYEQPDPPPPPPPPPPVDSCEDACGGVVDLCACDEHCVQEGDCCDDFEQACPDLCQAYWAESPSFWDQCTADCPCGNGEGDCDSSAHCNSGLYCAHDVGGSYGLDPTADMCQPLPTPNLHVEFVGCNGPSPQFHVSWNSSGITPDSYDVDRKIGFGSFQSYYDGGSSGSDIYWGSSERNDAFRVRVCKNGSCSNFTSRTTGSIDCTGYGDGGPMHPL